MNLGELKSTDFDDKDLKRLQTNDADGELYLRLFIRSRQGDLEKAYTTMVSAISGVTIACVPELEHRLG